MHHALGLHGSSGSESHSAEAECPQRQRAQVIPERSLSAGRKHCFVQDGEVPVTVLSHAKVPGPVASSPRHRQVAGSGLTVLAGRGRQLARNSSCGGNSADLSPCLERPHPCGAVLAGGAVAAAEVEEVVDLIMGGQEALCLPGRFEALYLPLPSPCRLMRVLRAIVETLVLSMLDAGDDLLLRCPVILSPADQNL